MRAFFHFAVTVLAIGLVNSVIGAEPLKEGDEAPDFELVGSDGNTYKLSDLVEEKTVVIAWFPKAFTGG